jgi:O-antigen/teichoic acid export membrane protein
LVVLRLGVTQNAYFYVTEMMGAAFFMVSPSVASAVFAEGVRARSDLRSLVSKSLRVIAVLLAPAVVVMMVAGRFILGLFGASYAAAGYGLLILLAISALPDAVSNVAVVVCRVTERLEYSSALNLAIFIMTLVGAWVLMPPLGIVGVGVAWLAAQTIGAIASLPAYAQIRKPGPSHALEAGRRYRLVEDKMLDSDPDRGLALLIDLAKRQSLDQFSRRLP